MGTTCDNQLKPWLPQMEKSIFFFSKSRGKVRVVPVVVETPTTNRTTGQQLQHLNDLPPVSSPKKLPPKHQHHCTLTMTEARWKLQHTEPRVLIVPPCVRTEVRDRNRRLKLHDGEVKKVPVRTTSLVSSHSTIHSISASSST